MSGRNIRSNVVGVLVALTTTIVGAQEAAQKVPTEATPQSTPQPPARTAGYLPSGAIPSSALLAPTPPAPGSAAMKADEENNVSALALHGTPRWELAYRDSVLSFPALAQTFSCALNLPVGEERTPKLIALLRKTVVDAGRATAEAKQLYRRTRPFAVNGKPICTPDREEPLRRDGSYPSGHSSIGWSLGLVLSEVSPEQATALIGRGREFGESRLVCNVHWQSDVVEGQLIGSAVVARLNAEPAFRDDVAAARAEVDALRAKGLSSDADCDAEARVLKSWK